MNKTMGAMLLAATILGFAGCEDSDSRDTRPKIKASTEKGNSPPQAASPAAPKGPEIPPPPAAPKTPQPPIAAQPSIELSMGTALAQTTVEGTMMFFSVEYEFTQGGQPASNYIWVIERTNGSPAKIAVQMGGKNKLLTPMAKWRSEDGPFNSHIEDFKGNRLSNSIEMK
jgi:hypothetical protein